MDTVTTEEPPPRLPHDEEQALRLLDRLDWLLKNRANFTRVTWQFVREFMLKEVADIDATLAIAEEDHLPAHASLPLVTGSLAFIEHAPAVDPEPSQEALSAP